MVGSRYLSILFSYIEYCIVRKTLEFLYTGDYTYEALSTAKRDMNSENIATDLDTDVQPEAGTEVFSESHEEASTENLRTGQAYFHAQMYAQGDYFSN
jgi:hypothetical protein